MVSTQAHAWLSMVKGRKLFVCFDPKVQLPSAPRVPTSLGAARRRQGSWRSACRMPLASSDGAVAPEGPPRGRVAAANAFAAALADEYGSERDEITPPITSLPNEDAWRE